MEDASWSLETAADSNASRARRGAQSWAGSAQVAGERDTSLLAYRDGRVPKPDWLHGGERKR